MMRHVPLLKPERCWFGCVSKVHVLAMFDVISANRAQLRGK